jgi:hypothetical protein
VKLTLVGSQWTQLVGYITLADSICETLMCLLVSRPLVELNREHKKSATNKGDWIVTPN